AETLGGKPASAYVLLPQGGTGAGRSGTAGVGSAISPAASCTAPPCAVVTAGGTPGFLSSFLDATTIQNSPIFANNGLVGIGNSNPVRTLDVSGEIAVRGGNIFLQRNLTDQAGRRNWAWGTETFNVGDISMFVSTSNSAFPSVPVFTALSNGNMGIGLATPQAKLDVAGNFRVSSNVTIGSASQTAFLTVVQPNQNSGSIADAFDLAGGMGVPGFAGANINLTGGAGGSNSVSGNGGTGGSFNMGAGSGGGGSGSGSFGGFGGSMSISAGGGGSGGTQAKGSPGGAVNIRGGSGGSGEFGAANGGDISLTAGD